MNGALVSPDGVCDARLYTLGVYPNGCAYVYIKHIMDIYINIFYNFGIPYPVLVYHVLIGYTVFSVQCSGPYIMANIGIPICLSVHDIGKSVYRS